MKKGKTDENYILSFLKENGFVPMRAEISPGGRVVLTDYYINPKGKICRLTSDGIKMYDKYVHDKDGYNRQPYYVAGRNRMMFSQRLVCLNFNENTENKPVVNHLNLIKSDNRADNLEWCTVQENAEHATQNRDKIQHYIDYPIIQLKRVNDNTFNVIRRYSSRIFVPTILDNRKIQRQYVTKNCKGWSKSYHGYVFLFEKDLEDWKKENHYRVIEK